MSRKAKIAAAVGVVVVVIGGVIAGISYNRRGVVTVQTGRVIRQNLKAVVTASGEIRPRNYVNIGTNTAGPSRIVQLFVKEGDRVRKGQLLARLESVQPEAEVAAQKAALSSAEAEVVSAKASLEAAERNLESARAVVERARAELERTRLLYERARQLYEERLIARQEFDQRRVDYEAAQAALKEAEARRQQAEAQRAQAASNLAVAERRVAQAQANLRRATDLLNRTYAISPIDGVVTNLPVRVGETVVPGIQNSPASLIMTIADMSLITAEVMVDETDIVHVRLGQPAEITIDAIPDKTFRGHVIEIGNTAILRSSGLAASQSNVATQEAKDFKVVIALENPPAEIRPGLSCTAKITTATRQNVLTIPLQALTVRKREDLEAPPRKPRVAAASPANPRERQRSQEEIQGVFVVENGRAIFRPVEIGIMGAADVEVIRGLKEGEEIITGSYSVIRTIRNYTKVKVNNRVAEAGRSAAS